MSRRPTRTVPTVIVHGWQDSGPGHWQRWLADRLREAGREVRYPDLPDPDVPSLERWLVALRTAMRDLPDDGFDVVAHSLGAILWLHHAATPATDCPRPARVALVAPPSPRTTIPELAPFFPVPLDIDAVRRAADGTVLVGSDADPYTPEGIAAAYGRPLKMPTTIISGGGHLNIEAGYGEWPALLSWCGRDNLAFIA
ncbi:MAG: RBBP9/YdeN family alpha/beta hydrolase [Jatrophihabitantaceae bacterium]